MAQVSTISRESQNQSVSQRIALLIQYVGTRFHGWQRQSCDRSVQGDVENAIASFLGYSVTIHGAGRTDAGVHAAGQVAHFEAPLFVPARRWRTILNSRLPQDVLILESAAVSDDWHAQFSAQWRRYRYTLYTDSWPNLFVSPFAWHYYYEPIDTGRMQQALDPLLGHHDLTAFHRARSGRAHSWVDLQAAVCCRTGPFVTVELQASGFLYGMVRLIMGLLVQVGRGQLAPEGFQTIWKTRQREKVKYSAPAKGLCLLRVGYESLPFAKDVWFDSQPQFSLNSANAAVV